ncbi:hypothetical protein GCM10009676_10160 [Prauserella halophila]|uniref:Uncharacterized protein n=1 Tax=Prauserella halophila TaxID=185641 RepID=A0ABP4GQB9_9PSEU|nr:hypothetical protein [Prauserella halophila]MCP2235373.1 hypothetical protein [Prauserella halophila]
MEFMTTIDTAGISGNRSALLGDGQFVRALLSCAPVDRDRRRSGLSLDLGDLGVFGVRGGTTSHVPGAARTHAGVADLGNPVPRPQRRQLRPIQIQGKPQVPPGLRERRRLAIG